jgi:hypothetical protein
LEENIILVSIQYSEFMLYFGNEVKQRKSCNRIKGKGDYVCCDGCFFITYIGVKQWHSIGNG